MDDKNNDATDSILTVDGKPVKLLTEEEIKAQKLEKKAELNRLLESGEIEPIEYNRRLIDLEVPDVYKPQHKKSRKSLIWSSIFLGVVVLLCSIPAMMILISRFYFQNTLKSEGLPDYSNVYTSSIEQEPIQIPINNRHEKGKYKGRNISITYMYYYDISGIVTSVHDYWGTGGYDTLVPRDVCIVYGSSAKLFETGEARFSQSERACRPHYNDINSVDQSELSKYRNSFGQDRDIITSATNNHLIASSVEIRDQIFGLKARDAVRIRGYLVSVSYDNISLTSSARRTDILNGACEVIYVTSIEKLERPAP